MVYKGVGEDYAIFLEKPSISQIVQFIALTVIFVFCLVSLDFGTIRLTTNSINVLYYVMYGYVLFILFMPPLLGYRIRYFLPSYFPVLFLLLSASIGNSSDTLWLIMVLVALVNLWALSRFFEDLRLKKKIFMIPLGIRYLLSVAAVLMLGLTIWQLTVLQ